MINQFQTYFKTCWYDISYYLSFVFILVREWSLISHSGQLVDRHSCARESTGRIEAAPQRGAFHRRNADCKGLFCSVHHLTYGTYASSGPSSAGWLWWWWWWVVARSYGRTMIRRKKVAAETRRTHPKTKKEGLERGKRRQLMKIE